MRSGPSAGSASGRMLELTQPCTEVGKPIWPRLNGLSPGLQKSRVLNKSKSSPQILKAFPTESTTHCGENRAESMHVTE